MTIKRRYFKNILFTGVITMVASGSAIAARIDYYGYSPAVPKTTQLPQFESKFPFILNEKRISLFLEIEQTGTFKKAVQNKAEDSVISNYVLSSLKQMTFEPALKDGEPISSVLPIWATVNPRFQSTVVEFPVGADHQITNRSLYHLALEKLEVELPEIYSFPPYFCDLSPVDSLRRLPFSLIKLNLSDAGQVDSSEIIKTNLSAFSSQLQSAALWAGISPLKLEGKAVSSRVFLLVLFYPQLQYPTNRLVFDSGSIYQWHERWRVQILPDTVGIMFPPMPQNRDIVELTLTDEERSAYGEVVADLIIDTVGNVRVRSIDSKKPPLHKAIAFSLNRVKFFPATNYSGQAVNFNGKARFSFRNNTKVQVEYLWLSD